MTEPVKADDLKDLRIRLQQRVNRMLAAGIIVLLVFILVGSWVSFSAWQSSRENKELSGENHDILLRRLNEKDAQIAAYQDVQDQAVDAITRLARQVQALGGDPGEIRLTPPTTTTRPSRDDG